MALVVTSLGKIKGRLARSKKGQLLYTFKGIPYAQPPLGELRFARPKPVKPWLKTLDLSGKKEAPGCLQVNVISPESKFLMGQEDCLYLNVYSPHLPGGGIGINLPVIVWIHGGAFCLGSNDSRLYGPDLILDYNVVFVAINYRLGPLGFLTLDKAYGNQGMHDQVMALKWVQEHIRCFGGDAGNVTIMGESAGAMSCLLHLVSPLSQNGLFHKIIATSGSPSTPFLHLDRKPEIYGRAFAKHILKKKISKRKHITDETLLRMLRDVPAKTLVEATTLFKDWDVHSPLQWKPSLDPDSPDPFLPIPFDQAIQEGKFDKNVIVMAGCTSEEGLIFSTQFLRSQRRWRMLFDHWDHWAPLLFFNRETELISLDDITKSAAIKQKFFSADSMIPPLKDGTIKIMEQIFSTAVFHAPMVKDIKLMASHGVKIYAFDFAYKGSMTLCDVFRLSPIKLFMNFFGRHIGANLYQKELGVCHGDDLFFIFPFALPGFPKTLKTRNDKLTSQRFLTYLTNFASHGDPGNVNNVTWQCLPTRTGNEDLAPFQMLRIDTELSFVPMDQGKWRRLNFWNEEVCPNEKGLSWSTDPIRQIHHVIAERRSSLLDSQQLFT